MPKVAEPTAKMKELLKRSGSEDVKVSFPALDEIAKAFEVPLRQGVMSGDVVGSIFETLVLDGNQSAEYPLDWLTPGTEKDFIAFTLPSHGHIPDRRVEGDYVSVPVFSVGNSIGWTRKYARDARWDIVGKALNVLKAGFIKKFNDDAWHTLLTAALDRNIMAYDADASAGQFTKRLVSLMKTLMRRNGGGNSTSVNRRKLTDLWVSPEAMEDIRNWGVDQIDEVTRKEIFDAADGSINRIFSVNLHDMDELGVGQEYQLFFTGTLAGTLASSDVELVVGMDLSGSGAFVHPVREEVQIFTDETMHRQQLSGFYGWGESGWAVLELRNLILGSF